LEGPKRVFP
jgi:hypothetical protein